VGALVGGQATNEEGFLLQRLLREGLGSSDIDSRGGAPAIPLEVMRALADPGRQATVPDLEFAHTVLVLGCEPLDEAPIWDLRIRKGVRRRGVRLAVASARPSALDVNAGSTMRFPPGEGSRFLAALDQALAGESTSEQSFVEFARFLRGAGGDIVIVWGQRIGAGAVPALLSVAGRLGARLLEIPSGANGRGLREAGVVPNAAPGYAELPAPGRSAMQIARAAADGAITALYLFQTDPVRELPDRTLWNQALHAAPLVVAHASVLTEGIREHASVIFPAESHAEKEGTVVHPDGRIQRLRTAIRRPGEVRAGWSVLSELARRVGLDTRTLTAPMAFRQLVTAVPFYRGLTLEELGGRGVRWPEREEAGLLARGEAPAPAAAKPGPIDAAPSTNGALRLGVYRPIWAAPEVELSPALHFTIAEQQVELSPEDARRLGLSPGDEVEVASNGTRVRGRAAVRSGVPAGVAFVAEGIASESGNALTQPFVEVHKA
jgi:NADH-quinone oxidoreductase subunit G